MADDSFDDQTWESFKPDAARAIRATQEFEDAVARTLDRPFDTQTYGGVESALEELRAAAPAAVRVSRLTAAGA
ncbi:hypothetical protein DC31_00260 [Microbacterium sp. CH12i]|uniref:hypothetical protein n=1 Tax=Microbacterium sp. CH12i TaxID=1479651 RepID=UPI000460BEDC|nr:hypothetical protein [Microbacterium sp. CH12i]KDA07188.1 hypothetical protein DC31_00260 [Microbacterium sp. CH12i]